MRAAAVRTIQIGAIAIVLVASTLTVFDLDRFIVPKELVLHVTALVAALFAFGAIRTMPPSPVDKFLGIYLLLSAVSAIFATNPWLGFRAFALSASAVLLFFTARALAADPSPAASRHPLPRERADNEMSLPREREMIAADARAPSPWGEGGPKGRVRGDAIINALALAVVIASAISLAEAFGLRLALFASTRVPGGTLGNRNFVAHLAAIGLPLLFTIASRGRFLPASIGVAIVTASLVLTRSRGAWIAAAVMLIVYAISARSFTRFAGVLGFAAAGALIALVVPNTLKWRGENPYLQSVAGVANYEEGSGRGRLTQYKQSLFMAVNHPIFGVGPGNWPVIYPHFAARNDPSIGDDNMTFNPWPSSDWIAFVSERGIVATICLLLALAFLIKDATARAMIAAAAVDGLFDAVLLLPVPAFVLFAALGALTGGGQAILPVTPPRKIAWPATILLMLISAAGIYRSGSQLVAMALYDSPSVAAKIDPGNFRIQRRAHPKAAHALFPYAR